MYCTLAHCILPIAYDTLLCTNTYIGVLALNIHVLHDRCKFFLQRFSDAQSCRPEVYGVVPMTRFRHTGVIVAPEQSSTVQQTVNQLLHPAKRDASQGSVILLFGGYNTMGQEFGGNKIEVGCLQHGHLPERALFGQGAGSALGMMCATKRDKILLQIRL